MRSNQAQAERSRVRLRETLVELLEDVDYVDPRAIRYKAQEHPVEHIAQQIKCGRMLAITPAFAQQLVKALKNGT